jgi:hypothetical protein
MLDPSSAKLDLGLSLCHGYNVTPIVSLLHHCQNNSPPAASLEYDRIFFVVTTEPHDVESNMLDRSYWSIG